MLAKNPLPLVVIVGETGSGKSALALELAKRFDGEIISADSWTVYKDFNIGTAKPSGLERAMIPHHLLDVADAHGGFNAVVFQQLALAAIGGIQRRGRLPILVGGTGLYIDSVLYEYQFLPPTDPALRIELNKLSLDEVLKRADDMGLDTTGIDLRNKRRVIRLIENEGLRPGKKELRANTLLLGLQVPREQLRDRVMLRTDAMLRAGLESEARRLADEYGWEAEPMKGIGYWQWREYFAGRIGYEDVRDKIIKATMDLAKRQRTWFKRNPSIHYLSTADKLSEAVDLVTTFLNKS
jgi:tRNA dimethylallyltransferase